MYKNKQLICVQPKTDDFNFKPIWLSFVNSTTLRKQRAILSKYAIQEKIIETVN